MSYRATRDDQGQVRLLLTDEPDYCHALAQTPDGHEAELDEGSWLVMAFAAWSMPDIRAVQTALDIARSFGGKLKLGLRPFEDEDIDRWHPGPPYAGQSPLWALLRDGELRWAHNGPLAAADVAAAASRVL